MRRISPRFTIAAAVVTGISTLLATAPAAHADDTVTVMSRNLYLGADVAVALELLPDMPAAAQFMWEQVAATDFTARAAVLAAELARDRPDVVGLQEATTWECRTAVVGESTVVFDFTQQLLEATQVAGVEYVVASVDGERAFNPGYSIPAIPFLTTVRDPATFQSLFGTDEAACGFTIADALLVRADLADRVTAVGNVDYDEAYAVVPVLFEVDRGFAWADLRFDEGVVRFVATHLESMWSEGATPHGRIQVEELITDLARVNGPLIVIGDFNADPRDPRPGGDPNPGLQPDTSTGCAAQVESPTEQTALDECNAYWRMRSAGFIDVGPDVLDPRNATWGASALLAGPDLARLAEASPNPYGYTDRLDYVFVRGGVEVVQAALIGAAWPDGADLWACAAPEQVANADAAASAMGASLGEAVCLPTDHVGLFATLRVAPHEQASTDSTAGDIAPMESDPTRVGIAILALIVLVVIGWRVLRRRL